MLNKLALAVGAMLEAQTPNTIELSKVLPLPTERQEMREPWRRRLLKHPRVESPVILEPFARRGLEDAACKGQTIRLSLDQTALGDRFAVLRLAVQIGDRSRPVAWPVEVGAAKIGVVGQQLLLERVRAWLPTGTTVLLLGDRFYPSAEWFAWLQRYGWRYRLRLQGNLTVDTGIGEVTTGALAQGVSERYLANVRLFTGGVPTHLGSRHETGHEAPWIIALDCPPTEATVRDYGARWAIGVSGQGHITQSVQVRPRLTDSSLVAWEAPWRESKTVKPSDLGHLGCTATH